MHPDIILAIILGIIILGGVIYASFFEENTLFKPIMIFYGIINIVLVIAIAFIKYGGR